MSLDPRIQRTRKRLQRSLEKLLESKDFEAISVRDIAQRALLNRATFYDHYPDKEALLECMVGSRFGALLAKRGVVFNGCGSALRAIVLTLCEYLGAMRPAGDTRRLQPHMELAIVAVLRRMILEGLQRHEKADSVSAEMRAASASWGIYGAVKEWVLAPQRMPAEEVAETVTMLIEPLLHLTLSHQRPAPGIADSAPSLHSR